MKSDEATEREGEKEKRIIVIQLSELILIVASVLQIKWKAYRLTFRIARISHRLKKMFVNLT